MKKKLVLLLLVVVGLLPQAALASPYCSHGNGRGFSDGPK